MTPNTPLVSVLIAARNEAGAIDDCLDSLHMQTYPAACAELIVIDGDSEDGTAARVQAWAAERCRPVTLIENPARTTPAAFNRGLAAARGAVIVLMGARARPAADFLEMSVAALARTGADAVGGVVQTVAQDTRAMARAIGLAQRSPFGVGDARYRYASEEGEVDTVNYGAYRRDVFERIGLFDESLQWVEDDEFNYRLRSAGGRLVLDPRIRVDYLARSSLRGLWLQRFRWGRGKPLVARRHPGQMRIRHAVPAAFVAALVVGIALWPLGRWFRLPLKATAAAYAIAGVVASGRLGARHGWPRETALVPVAFATMHVAYGAGAILGLSKLAVDAMRERSAAAEPETSNATGPRA